MSNTPEPPDAHGPFSQPKAPGAKDWPRIDAALDELLLMPSFERSAAAVRLASGDAAFARQLLALLDQLDRPDQRLERPALMAWSGTETSAPPETLVAGTRFGAWRVCELLGRGGMGEVYRAERADGQYEQQAAIKLMRADMAPHAARFQAERQIVARLDHPGIARLLDGGMAGDGRSFMVMELVHGLAITDWCRSRSATLDQRLNQFMQVCDAVAYAHRNLVVHRDIKPANVLVTDSGQPKLLDFGVARLLEGPAGEASREVLVTPGYASPEQLSGGPITTATDIYALGLLLYELLVDQPAFPVQQLALAAAMQQVLTQPAPTPSRIAQQKAEPPVSSPQLEGDLDAIVARTLRKEPEARYATVEELRADIARHLGHQPVLARRGNWAYVASRALRRHRAWATAGAVALIAVLGGAAATFWQARLAREEAARATAVKDFLLQVFRASDPRMASDKPRGQITARELLDAGSVRIEREFAAQPSLQIELMGVAADLYRELGEKSRHDQIVGRRIALADASGSMFPQVRIEALFDVVNDDIEKPDRESAQRRLAELDGRIHAAGLDEGKARGLWWTQKGRAEEPSNADAIRIDYQNALAIYDRIAPLGAERFRVLGLQGDLAFSSGRWEEALDRFRIALQAAERISPAEPVEGETMTLWSNIGVANLVLGRTDDAIAAYEKSTTLAQQTYCRRTNDLAI